MSEPREYDVDEVAQAGGAPETHEERATEPGGPGTVGAVDGAAAAGSPGAVSEEPEEEGVVPGSPPDPSIGPD